MRVALIVFVVALTLYAVLDCARTPSDDLPSPLPKPMWLLVILLFTLVGPIAWIITSRVKAAEERGGVVERTVWSSRSGVSFQRPAPPRVVAPDDNQEFLRDLEQDIRRRKHHRDDEDRDDKGRPDRPKG